MAAIRNTIVGTLTGILQALPESSLKTGLRCLFHTRWGAIPYKLLINKGDCVVQVGTPWTRTVSKLAQAAGNTGRVVIIEPEEETLEKLRSHIEANALNHITVIPQGAWKEKGHHKLLISPEPAGHRLEHENVAHYNDLDGYVSTRTIEVDTIDNMMRDAGVDAIDFISITVNGMELEVLQGMADILPRTKRLYVIGRGQLKDTGAPVNQAVVAFLQKNGFNAKIGKRRMTGHEQWTEMDGDVYAWKTD